jgi:hypothetical protein
MNELVFGGRSCRCSLELSTLVEESYETLPAGQPVKILTLTNAKQQAFYQLMTASFRLKISPQRVGR